MARKYFTKEEIELLSESKWVRKISKTSINFTKEFMIDIAPKLKTNSLRTILPIYGVDPNFLGDIRLGSTKTRIVKFSKRPEGFARKKGSGRPKVKFNDLEEEKDYLRKKLELDKAEYAQLKLRIETMKPCGIKYKRKVFEMIKRRNSNKGNRLSIRNMCKIGKVSRSGYCSYMKRQDGLHKIKKNDQDKLDYKMIKEVFEDEQYEKGAKQIKMQLLRKFGVNMGLNKIRRIMKKYGIICTIRQPKRMKATMRAFQTKNYKKNILNRKFEQGVAKKVLLTDISYIKYARGAKTAYLCTIKDATTKQILAWNLTQSLELDIVLDTVKMLIREYGKELDVHVLIHSDQGCHFTANDYQSLLRMNHIIQSMSRRGNCWDNAPQESFFGTFKCESNYKKCHSFEELIKESSKYIDYYNMRRPQWDLNKMTPNEYDWYLSQPVKCNLQLPMVVLPNVIYLPLQTS